MSPYERLETLLAKAGVDLDAAEVHGFIAGRLCCNPYLPWEEIAEEVLPDDTPHSLRGVFKELVEEARKKLLATDFSFDLWLPSEETSLRNRAEALAEWCQGFLYGVGLGGRIAWSKEAEEVLHDVQKIATLDANAEGEEDELAFMEITEYLRTAIQLLIEEALARHHEEK